MASPEALHELERATRSANRAGQAARLNIACRPQLIIRSLYVSVGGDDSEWVVGRNSPDVHLRGSYLIKDLYIAELASHELYIPKVFGLIDAAERDIMYYGVLLGRQAVNSIAQQVEVTRPYGDV
ncbi:MAG: hypothetical protein JWL89_112 [Candidatus Saccharibacteria bacterium]|nr:hypothetical protein [Candidatus Saccharibacteria bacterium]